MAIDRTVLQHLSDQTALPSHGITALSYSIHRTPGLREWVTLESVALPPIPVQRSDSWGLVSLIAVPVRSADAMVGWRTPWGAVEWSLPDCSVVQTLDLSQQAIGQSLPLIECIPIQPADPTVSADARSRAQQETALFQVLEDFFADPQVNRLPSLASHYAKCLPAALYPYYHALIPESQSWLIADFSKSSGIGELRGKEAAPPTPQLTQWLRRGQSIAAAFGLTDIKAELTRLEQRRKRPGFRLAIVGEFSRGKSTLINRLLDQEILPMGAIPTTATLTSILPGSTNEMRINPGQTGSETRPLTLSSWDDLLAVDATGQERTVLTPVRLTLDHEWLRSLDVELIDTPGAGDLSEQRAALITDLLSQCDAAVLVVSGTLPFSLTEKSFLEEKVIGQHVPRLLVVVSKLDTIDLAERPAVFNVLQERIAQVSPTIPVLPAHPLDTTVFEAEVLTAIRHQIAALADQDDRRQWRDRQIVGQLLDCLKQMATLGQTAIATAKLEVAERQQRLQELEVELQSADLSWEQLRLSLDQHRLKHDQQLRLHVLEARQELLELLTLELKRTPEPKVWWERDLPFRVRRELLVVSRKCEEFILKAIAQDMEWLDQELNRSFATHFSHSAESKLDKLEIQPDYGQISLTDTKRYRLLTRLGCSGGVLCGYLFGGPIGIVASTGIWFLGEQILTKEVENQRRVLLQELDRRLSTAIDVYCAAVSERLRQLYRQIASDTQKEQTLWRSTRQQALQANLTPEEEQRWQHLVEQSVALQQTILAAL